MRKFFCIFMSIWITVGACFATYSLSEDMNDTRRWAAVVMIGILALCISAWGTPLLADGIQKVSNRFSNRPFQDIISTVAGLIAGLLIAALVSTVIKEIPVIGPYVSIVCFVFFGYMGATIAYRRRKDMMQMLPAARRELDKHHKDDNSYSKPKILDTSVIIDGRIADVCHSGFVEGKLILPQFVLDELRHVSDSADVLKRNRGRRGLDILHRLQKEFPGRVEVTDIDYVDIAEVDSKLLRLAQDIGGVVLTNDFNLNKVAKVQGVKVLNINELSNALKPVVLPGETMEVDVVAIGKEPNQGVAYLDDGTMIVIENGKPHLGENIKVEVSSVLQTAAGRMIFVRAKS